MANPDWDRRCIALVLGTLGIFMAVSTVCSILLRPRPEPDGPAAAAPQSAEPRPRQIVARYPNHVWSVDRTRVWRWRIWPIWVLVAMDQFSRKAVATCPLEGPNAGWIVKVLARAFSRHGAPKDLITDQEGVFSGDVFRNLLRQWHVKQRFGAVGKHGSVAVTERIIRTMKGEWLRRVPVIKGFDRLEMLLEEFACYYNCWRPHMNFDGAVPDLIYAGHPWQPPRSAKAVPVNIERRFFPETRVTAFRLAKAA